MCRKEKIIPTFANNSVFICDEDYPYRSIDGTCNNLDSPQWGKPNSTYITFLPSVYGDSNQNYLLKKYIDILKN